MTEKQLKYDDLDDIIGIADKLQQSDAEADKMTFAEIQRVADELNIPTKYLQRAIEELKSRKEREQQQQIEVKNRKAKLKKMVATYLVLGVFGVVLWFVFIGLSNFQELKQLREQDSEIKALRSAVINAKEREALIKEQFQTQPDSPQKNAELSGSINRIQIAMRRYDDAVKVYNQSADKLTDLKELPKSHPLSSEITKW